jgi:hypothetical protein
MFFFSASSRQFGFRHLIPMFRTLLVTAATALILGFATFFPSPSQMLRAQEDELTSTIQVGSSRIDVHIESGEFAVSHAELLDWVHHAANSVTTYYGRFPVPLLKLFISSSHGRGVGGGKTFGFEDGGRIQIHVGKQTIVAGLAKDWMLTHEMVHLAFPSVADKHHWLEEGLATYVEPIARVRAHYFDPAEMWFEVVRDLPQGLPASGDEGLDHTHTWGRTYWGGALYCMLADIQIHKLTQNKKGLDDALRGILNAGGDIRYNWDLEKALDVGDKATGVAVLRPLYDKMKNQPYPVDLDAMWKELGVARTDDTVHFIDSAPLAATLRAITNGAPSGPAINTHALNTPPIILGRNSRPQGSLLPPPKLEE